jgi:hypothetical protein
MDASAKRHRAMRIQFLPQRTHIGVVIKNRTITLLEIVKSGFQRNNANTTSFSEAFMKILPRINGVFMENKSLSNRFRNRIDNPRVNKVITSFPRRTIQIQSVRNQSGSIDEKQFVLGSQSTAHRTTPCEVVGTSERRSDQNGAWSFTRVNIEDRIGIVRWNLRNNVCNTRRHRELSKKLQRITEKSKEEDEDLVKEDG